MTTSPSAPVTPERIYQFAFGYAPPLILEAAIRHHVFDVLENLPQMTAWRCFVVFIGVFM